MRRLLFVTRKRLPILVGHGIALLLMLVLAACGDGSDSGDFGTDNPLSETETGSAMLKINWHDIHAVKAEIDSLARAPLDCENIGVVSLTCQVYDASQNLIASGGPWQCLDHKGRIEPIAAGSDRTIALLAWNAAGGEGSVVYHGYTGSNINITSGEITDAGTIDAYPFIPQLSSPTDGQTLTINTFLLTWDSVATANQYRIIISENGDFTVPVIDAQTHVTAYAANNLEPSRSYYWKIYAIDVHGNESAESEVWHFNTTATVTCSAPTLDSIGNQQVNETETLTFTVSATDPDGSVLTFTHSSLPQGAVFNSDTDSFSWTPGDGVSGNYPVTFTVCDDCTDGPLCDSEQINIAVGDVCQPPVLSFPGDQQVDEAETLTFSISATDPDSSTLTLTHSSLPQGATFNTDTGTFRWTPGYGNSGNYPVTFSVCDDCPDGPLCDSEEVNITVGDMCRRPNLTAPGDQQVNEAETLTFSISATDPDGDSLTYSASDLPAGASFDGETRTFTWTTDYGDSGNYPVTFTVCDDCPDGPLCDSEDVNITVGDMCRRPNLSVPGDQQVDETETLTFTISATDLDGDALTYSASDLPVGASFDGATGTFTWITDYGDSGNYPVTFTVCDDCPDGSLCDSEEVDINVGDVCRRPVLSVPGNQQVDPGETLSFTISATDLDGDRLTYNAGDLPADANFDRETRTFSWTPDNDDSGNYRVTFTACDDCLTGPLCDSEEVNITVQSPCRPPNLTNPGDQQVNPGETLTLTISATDPDGGSLTYNASNLPDGALFDSAAQTFSWTPNYGDSGNYPVTFGVCDDCPASPLCDSEEVNITVESPCRPPNLTNPGDQQMNPGETLTLTISATDPDGGNLTYSAGGLPNGADFDSATRTFSWTPDDEDSGDYPVTFTVCDDCPEENNGPLCDSEAVNISVLPPPLVRPTLSSPVSGSSHNFYYGSITFNWEHVPGATHYYIALRAPTSIGNESPTRHDARVEANSYTLSFDEIRYDELGRWSWAVYPLNDIEDELTHELRSDIWYIQTIFFQQPDDPNR